MRLDLPTSQAFTEALQGMGLPEDKAHVLARSCGRSVTILMRLFANGDAGCPSGQRREALLFLLYWRVLGTRRARKIRNNFGTRWRIDAYDKYDAELRQFQRMDDPPIDREGTVWKCERR